MSRSLAALFIACLAIVPSYAHEMSQHGHAAGGRGSRTAIKCSEPIPSCATAATPLFDNTGGLRLIYAVAGRMYVARSRDEGRTFEPAVALNDRPADIDDNSDGRPILAIASDGTIAAAWSVWRDTNWNGQVLTTFSKDDGKSYAVPKPITESVSQRFATIAFSRDGVLLAAWLDKRNLAAAKAAGDDYAGAGLAVSTSRDGGATFAPVAIVSDRTCECCRVSLAFDPDGAPVVGWRQIFGKNFRDHEVGRLSSNAKTLEGVRVSEDNWAIDACPHHGPSLSVSPDGVRHIAWYTGGTTRNGLFYAHQSGQNGTFSVPQAFGNAQQSPSHPQVLAIGNTVVRAWKEFDGEQTSIVIQRSEDGGTQWNSPEIAAATTDASDHPILVSRGKQMYLSWLTKADGYRLLALMPAAER